jgi:hypothetical protein
MMGRRRWLPWRSHESHEEDRYWEFFIRNPPADPANTVTALIRNAPQGNVFPTKADIHTPEITARHVKELARYLGADMVGIARAPSDAAGSAPWAGGPNGHPYAVVCALRDDYEADRSPGIGGQVPVQNALFVTFVLSAWIRELGFRATVLETEHAAALAAEARLGTVDARGKLVTRSLGTHVYVGPVIWTDLPLAIDG